MSWSDIPGWSCHRLREWYDEVATTALGRDVLVEVGVAYGASLAYLCEQLDGKPRQRVHVVGIDVWAEHQGFDGQLSPEVMARVKAHGNPMRACVRELERAYPDAFRRTTLIRATGVDAADGFADESVTVVFLDEHHTYDSVAGAIRAWMPRILSGGYLSGHDCNPHYPGVLEAVRELLPGAEVREPHPADGGWGGVWTWEKP